MSPFEEKIYQTRSGDGLTRAWSRPDGYEAYEGGNLPIGVCFTQNNKDPKIGSLFYSSGKWRKDADLELTAGQTYYLYGYIPHKTGIKYSITDSDDSDGANNSYSSGATLTLKDVPAAMPNDLCVIVGAKHGYDKEHDGNSDGTNRLRLGDFSFTASKGADGKDFVFLLFDHLYSALSINMRVYGEYDKLRTIKLKSLNLKTIDASGSKDKTDIAIKFEADENTTSPIKIQSISYTPTGNDLGTGDGVEFWPAEPNTVETLTTEYKSFPGYFMPMGVNTLILTSIYDVYDKEGKLVRENCKATNTMLVSELFDQQATTLRGYRYTIDMTIRPTYLHVLSDSDLENPGIDVVITE